MPYINAATQKLKDLWINIKALSEQGGFYGAGAAELLKSKHSVTDDEIKKTIADFQKQIRQNPEFMQNQLGNTFSFFKLYKL